MVVGEGGPRPRLGDHRRVRGRPGHRGVRRRDGQERPAAARAEPGRRGGVGDRAHLRRHDRGLRGAGDARPDRRRDARLLRAGARPRRDRAAAAAIVTRLDPPAQRGQAAVLDRGDREGTLGRRRSSTSASRRRPGRRCEAGKSRTLFLEGVRAFAEVFTPPAILLVVGASHVAMPLTDAGQGARLPDHRDRRAAPLRDPRSASRDVDDLRIGVPSELVQQVPLIADHRAGAGGARLQVRPAGAAPRAQHAGRLHRAPRQHAGAAPPS